MIMSSAIPFDIKNAVKPVGGCYYQVPTIKRPRRRGDSKTIVMNADRLDLELE